MIFTPASTSWSATPCAASAGTARTPTTTSSSLTTCWSSSKRAHRDAAELRADHLRVGVEDRDDAEAVVGEDVRAGDRLAEVAGAEEGDVVLARGVEDLADLADQRLDPVADAALAELAEAGEVAADLGRVDVGVLGELLRGDRLAAHLAGLDQHLQVAREPRRDAQREAVAIGGQGAVLGAVLGDCRLGHGPTVCRARVNASRSKTSSLTTRPSTSTTGIRSKYAFEQAIVGIDVDLAQARFRRRQLERSRRAPRRRDGSRGVRRASRALSTAASQPR